MGKRTAHEAFCSSPSSSSSSSSSKHWIWKYDVFLSFRGEDTRNNFTGHLYMALKASGINVFMDDNELRRGEDIREELVWAIQGSRISVIVFSKSYAASSWCLGELVKIMECRRTLGQLVLPIFYDVDPSHVRKQTGCFQEAFVEHENKINSASKDPYRKLAYQVMRWRSALTEAADLSGWDLTNTADGHEAKFIRKIVDEICRQLNNSTNLCEAVYPVGLDSRVQDMSRHLDVAPKEVRMVGIWGISGVGKTTVAKAIYNKFFQSFEGKSFLANVRETTKQPNGLVLLQEQLLSDILKPSKIKLDSVHRGINVIKERLRCKRILVIIDDVDQVDQLNAIARNRDWFGSGSRIVITTTDEHLLKQLEVDEIYLVPEMNEVEALELFSWHAFKNSGPPNQVYYELSRRVVAYCGGLPLALEVLGSFFFGRSIPEWKSALDKLKEIPHRPVQEKIRVSFDGLNDDNEKNIFLDICCFFIGMDKNYVNQVLDGCGFYTEIGMSVLLQRRLVTVSKRNKLMMHDLLRDMGREIVRGKSPEEPGKRSRLWQYKEVSDVLTKHSGTEDIEGLVLNLPSSDKVSFSAKAFTKMQRLRLLQLNYVQLTEGYEHISKELRWLCWHGFPLKFIPSDLHQGNLVVIDLKYSNLTHAWKDPGLLEKLKILNLSHSHYLSQSPVFSKLPYLEQLILEDCQSLSEVHESIGYLERLSLVNLNDCKLIEDLPRSLYHSNSIEILLLSGCSRFGNLDEDLGEMVSLKTLSADNTAIRKLPASIVRLKHLTDLSLCGLKGSLSNILPGNIPKSPDLLLPSFHGLRSLRNLDLFDCKLTDDAIPKDVWSLPALNRLNLSRNCFHTLPSLSGLSKLQFILVDYCTNLHTISDLPRSLMLLAASGCTALERIPNLSEMLNMVWMSLHHCPKLINIPRISKLNHYLATIVLEGCDNITANLKEQLLQGWNMHGAFGVILPGNDIPEWFTYVAEGPSITFELPQVLTGCLNGFAVCIAYSTCRLDRNLHTWTISFFNYTKGFSFYWPLEFVREDGVVEDQIWIGRDSWDRVKSYWELGHKVGVCVDSGPHVIVKKIGVSLVEDEFINGNNDSVPFLLNG